MFDIDIVIKDNKVLGEILVDSYFFDKNKYDYAFYLYRNEERVDLVWYSESMKVAFNTKEITGNFYIKVYIKDKLYGDKRTFSSKKIFA